MAEREVILKLKLDIEGANLPKIDTRLADQSLRDLEQRARQTGREIAQSISGGGAAAAIPRGPSYTPYTAGFSYVGGQRVLNNPNAPGAYRAAGLAYPHIASEFSTERRLPRSLPNPIQRPSDSPFSTSRGGPAYGPVSDPGSHGTSSLSTARGYDVALLRETMSGGSVRNAESYARALNNVRMAMRGLRENAAGLAGSMALFNLSMQNPNPTFGDRITQGVSALGVATYGAGAIRAGVRGVGTAGAAGMGFVGAAGATGVKSGIGYLAGAGLGIGGLAAGAVGAGAVGYLGYQLYAAMAENSQQKQIGGGLDQRIASGNDARLMQNMLAPYRNAQFSAMSMGIESSRLGAMAASGGLGIDEFNRRNAGIRGNLRSNITGMGSRIGDERYSYEEQSAAAASLRQNVQALQQAEQQRVQANIANLNTKREELELTRQAMQLERERAQSGAGSVGRLGARDRRRVSRLMGREMNERNALEIERITGYREGSPQSEFLDRFGQQQIDSDPNLRSAFGGKTSSELEQLNRRIEQNSQQQTGIANAIEKLLQTQAEVNSKLERTLLSHEKRLMDMWQGLVTKGVGK